MALVAKKPCSFGGKDFFIGDEIPNELVNDPAYQEKLGVLIHVDDAFWMQGMHQDGIFSIPIIKDVDADTAEVLDIKLSEGEVQQVFAILQMDEEHAVEAIERVEEENILIVVHACDSRLACKNAAKQRAETLTNNLTIKTAPNVAKDCKSSTRGKKSK